MIRTLWWDQILNDHELLYIFPMSYHCQNTRVANAFQRILGDVIKAKKLTAKSKEGNELIIKAIRAFSLFSMWKKEGGGNEGKERWRERMGRLNRVTKSNTMGIYLWNKRYNMVISQATMKRRVFFGRFVFRRRCVSLVSCIIIILLCYYRIMNIIIIIENDANRWYFSLVPWARFGARACS